MPEPAHHPGEILSQRLKALGVTPTELARQLRVPANRITQIINGERGITGDSALRLAHWLGNAPEYWITLQALYDLQIAKAVTGSAIDALPTQAVIGTRRAARRQTPAAQRRTA